MNPKIESTQKVEVLNQDPADPDGFKNPQVIKN